MKCVMYGEQRHQLFETIHNKCNDYETEWKDAVDANSATKQYLNILKVLRESMEAIFPKTKCVLDPKIIELQKLRLECLKKTQKYHGKYT